MSASSFIDRNNQTDESHPNYGPLGLREFSLEEEGSLSQDPNTAQYWLSQNIPSSLLRHQAAAKARGADYPGAIAILTHLIEQNPISAIDYNNRGLMYLLNSETDKALADCERAIELNPSLAAAYNNRANCYAAKGEFTKALEDYDIAIDLNPLNFRAVINQGITLRQLGLYDWAIENFDRALILGQLEGYIYTQRGRTHHLAGDWNCAIADYRRAMAAADQPIDLPLDLKCPWRSLAKTWMNQLLSMANV